MADTKASMHVQSFSLCVGLSSSRKGKEKKRRAFRALGNVKQGYVFLPLSHEFVPFTRVKNDVVPGSFASRRCPATCHGESERSGCQTYPRSRGIWVLATPTNAFSFQKFPFRRIKMQGIDTGAVLDLKSRELAVNRSAKSWQICHRTCSTRGLVNVVTPIMARTSGLIVQITAHPPSFPVHVICSSWNEVRIQRSRSCAGHLMVALHYRDFLKVEVEVAVQVPSGAVLRYCSSLTDFNPEAVRGSIG